jgi:hypothetical protein
VEVPVLHFVLSELLSLGIGRNDRPEKHQQRGQRDDAIPDKELDDIHS